MRESDPVQNDRLTVANVGDSRAVLGRKEAGECKFKALHRTHVPKELDEAERVAKAGGEIRKCDAGSIAPQRVFMKHSPAPGLAMTRSMGDFFATGAGISFEAEIVEHVVSPEDEVLIVASDGVWEFMSETEVVEIALNPERDIKECAKDIVARAHDFWVSNSIPSDDITVVLVYLHT